MRSRRPQRALLRRLAAYALLALALLAVATGGGSWLLLTTSRRSRSQRVRRLPPPKRAPLAAASENATDSCAPAVLDAHAMPLHSELSARFHAELQRLAPTLPAPAFRGDHAFLCEEHLARREQWGNCLPVSGRTDEPFCAHASREDLLRGGRSICHASVLHLILVDVYEELAALGAQPALLYGTLLGAVRNQSLLAFTEDADVGFQDPTAVRRQWRPLHAQTLDVEGVDVLWRRGYHLFHSGIYRVCVAPTHPLASVLYDPHKTLGVEYGAPYVDLYRMARHALTGAWDVEQSRRGRRVPDAKVRPFAQVELLGRAFDTLADPVDFLAHEYGEQSYLTPERWPWTK
ncbi:hypothetical protein PybrP1_002868 [[Pythium] brassicae (nom. inval.)]|nr:hypothetical protein PybrP1_002868 [[Pythium] brassicae (nom. inval.)]